MSQQDELLEVVVELEALTRRLGALRHQVAEIVAAQREAPDNTYEALPHVAPFCADEPPSKPI